MSVTEDKYKNLISSLKRDRLISILNRKLLESLNSGTSIELDILSYTNNNQTIWSETGSGSFSQMIPNISGIGGEFSSLDLSDGLILDSETGEITIDDYSLIPLDENSFTITFILDDIVENVVLTVTKEVLYKAHEQELATSLLMDIDATTDSGDQVTQVDNVVSAVNDLTSNNNDAVMSNEVRKPLLVQASDGKRAFSSDGNRAGFTCNLGADVLQPFHIWGVISLRGQASSEITLITDSNNNKAVINFTTPNRSTAIFGSTGNSAAWTRQESADMMDYEFGLVHFYINGANSYIRINGGTIDLTFNPSTNALDQLIGLFSNYSFQTNYPLLARRFRIWSGEMTDATRAKFEGELAHQSSIQGALPDAHPYKTIPPLL